MEYSFPIGACLSQISILENKVDNGDRACSNLAVLTFSPTQYLVLQPLNDTENSRLSISPILSYERRRVILNLSSNPPWSQPFIGKKLRLVKLKVSDRGDREGVSFTFDQLSQSVSFISENSALKIEFSKHNEQVKTVNTQVGEAGILRFLKKKLYAFPQFG